MTHYFLSYRPETYNFYFLHSRSQFKGQRSKWPRIRTWPVFWSYNHHIKIWKQLTHYFLSYRPETSNFYFLHSRSQFKGQTGLIIKVDMYFDLMIIILIFQNNWAIIFPVIFRKPLMFIFLHSRSQLKGQRSNWPDNRTWPVFWSYNHHIKIWKQLAHYFLSYCPETCNFYFLHSRSQFKGQRSNWLDNRTWPVF